MTKGCIGFSYFIPTQFCKLKYLLANKQKMRGSISGTQYCRKYPNKSSEFGFYAFIIISNNYPISTISITINLFAEPWILMFKQDAVLTIDPDMQVLLTLKANLTGV
jgi:hypothetical protein